MERNRIWPGWHFAGRYLVSPDGEHITAERLRGLLWRDGKELRLAGFASRRKAENNKKRSAGGRMLDGARDAVIVHLKSHSH